MVESLEMIQRACTNALKTENRGDPKFRTLNLAKPLVKQNIVDREGADIVLLTFGWMMPAGSTTATLPEEALPHVERNLSSLAARAASLRGMLGAAAPPSPSGSSVVSSRSVSPAPAGLGAAGGEAAAAPASAAAVPAPAPAPSPDSA